jgi:hypothetical protein
MSGSFLAAARAAAEMVTELLASAIVVAVVFVVSPLALFRVRETRV